MAVIRRTLAAGTRSRGVRDMRLRFLARFRRSARPRPARGTGSAPWAEARHEPSTPPAPGRHRRDGRREATADAAGAVRAQPGPEASPYSSPVGDVLPRRRPRRPETARGPTYRSGTAAARAAVPDRYVGPRAVSGRRGRRRGRTSPTGELYGLAPGPGCARTAPAASAVASRRPSRRWRPAVGGPEPGASWRGSAHAARPVPRAGRGRADRRKRAKNRSRIPRTPRDRVPAARLRRITAISHAL